MSALKKKEKENDFVNYFCQFGERHMSTQSNFTTFANNMERVLRENLTRGSNGLTLFFGSFFFSYFVKKLCISKKKQKKNAEHTISNSSPFVQLTRSRVVCTL